MCTQTHKHWSKISSTELISLSLSHSCIHTHTHTHTHTHIYTLHVFWFMCQYVYRPHMILVCMSLSAAYYFSALFVFLCVCSEKLFAVLNTSLSVHYSNQMTTNNNSWTHCGFDAYRVVLQVWLSIICLQRYLFDKEVL